VQKVLREQGAKHVAEIGRIGTKAVAAKRDLLPEDVAPMPAPLFGRAPSVEHVNMAADNPSDKIIAEQRERLETVLDDLLNLRDLLHRGPKRAGKVAAAQ
jgi:hypothetical protein